jgi:hypothetical protein
VLLFSSDWGRWLSYVLSAVLEAGGLLGIDREDKKLQRQDWLPQSGG